MIRAYCMSCGHEQQVDADALEAAPCPNCGRHHVFGPATNLSLLCHVGGSYEHTFDNESWRKLREKVWRRDSYSCRICWHDVATLQVHHCRYENVRTAAEANDCVLVCQICHMFIHGRVSKSTWQVWLALQGWTPKQIAEQQELIKGWVPTRSEGVYWASVTHDRVRSGAYTQGRRQFKLTAYSDVQFPLLLSGPRILSWLEGMLVICLVARPKLIRAAINILTINDDYAEAGSVVCNRDKTLPSFGQEVFWPYLTYLVEHLYDNGRLVGATWLMNTLAEHNLVWSQDPRNDEEWIAKHIRAARELDCVVRNIFAHLAELRLEIRKRWIWYRLRETRDKARSHLMSKWWDSIGKKRYAVRERATTYYKEWVHLELDWIHERVEKEFAYTRNQRKIEKYRRS